MPQKNEMPSDELDTIEDALAKAEPIGEVDQLGDINDTDDDTENSPPEEPKMSDANWSEFVMSKFQESELDEKGNPFVTGLRRVARLLLGPIISSKCNVVAAPFYEAGKMSVCTVGYEIVFLWCRPEDMAEGMASPQVTFSDVADVHTGNTDPDFAMFPTSTAATRAEARCLRKALQLQRVTAAEELTKVAIPEGIVTGTISESQINFINIFCERNDIDVMKYVNSGKNKFAKIDEVPFDSAKKMIRHLSDLQNDQAKIPEAVRGYKRKWR